MPASSFHEVYASAIDFARYVRFIADIATFYFDIRAAVMDYFLMRC